MPAASRVPLPLSALVAADKSAAPQVTSLPPPTGAVMPEFQFISLLAVFAKVVQRSIYYEGG